MEYYAHLQKCMKRYLFDELSIKNTPQIDRDCSSTIVCPFCHRKLDNGEVAEIFEGDFLDVPPRCDIMNMWQLNTPQGRERYATSRPGSTSEPVVPNATCNSRSTRRTIVCQSTSTMDRTTTSRSS